MDHRKFLKGLVALVMTAVLVVLLVFGKGKILDKNIKITVENGSLFHFAAEHILKIRAICSLQHYFAVFTK